MLKMSQGFGIQRTLAVWLNDVYIVDDLASLGLIEASELVDFVANVFSS